MTGHDWVSPQPVFQSITNVFLCMYGKTDDEFFHGVDGLLRLEEV